MEDNYDRIDFTNKSFGKHGKSKTGAKISKHLVVGRSSERKEQYKVYMIKTGLPLVDFYFCDFDEVCKFAEWVDNIYSDYFPILETYPEIDLFSLVKWSVEDGIQMYEMIKLLETENETTLNSIASAHNCAERYVEHWTRNFD